MRTEMRTETAAIDDEGYQYEVLVFFFFFLMDRE